MERKTVTDWIFESIVCSFGVVSFLMMAAGIYQQEWWAGFGLVLSMTSLLCWISVFKGARRAQAMKAIPILPGKKSFRETQSVTYPTKEIRVS